DLTISKAAETDVPGEEAELEPVFEGSARLNEPVKFDDYTLYQSGYQLNEFSSMTFDIVASDDEDAEAIDTFTVDLMEPEGEYELDNGFRVAIDQYYPDYILTEDGIPDSETNDPRNPAFVFLVYPPDDEEPEVSFIGI